MLSPLIRKSNTVVLSPQLRSVSTKSFGSSSSVGIASSFRNPVVGSSTGNYFSLNSVSDKKQNYNAGLREFSTAANQTTTPPPPQAEQPKQQHSESNDNHSQQPKKKFRFLKTLLLITGSATVASYIYFKANGQDVKLEYIKRIPFRVTSHLWGKLAGTEVPESLRPAIYGTYASLFGVKVNEAEKPIEEYPSLAAFFCRKLKDGTRKIDAAPLVSPVDGTVIYYGPVTEDSLEQVKGINYSLTQFLGENEVKQLKDKNLFHVGIYLSPGDYHGIHSPCEWTVKERNHFPGYLFPVAKVAVDNIQGLFALNERVVLSGQWKHGFFSLTPVGASNVGTITMDFDKELSTNNLKDDYKHQHYYFKSYKAPVKQQKGEEIAFFKMGSTVILVFEVPKDQKFNFNLKPGQTVILGQSIGSLEKK